MSIAAKKGATFAGAVPTQTERRGRMSGTRGATAHRNFYEDVIKRSTSSGSRAGAAVSTCTCHWSRRARPRGIRFGKLTTVAAYPLTDFTRRLGNFDAATIPQRRVPASCMV